MGKLKGRMARKAVTASLSKSFTSQFLSFLLPTWKKVSGNHTVLLRPRYLLSIINKHLLKGSVTFSFEQDYSNHYYKSKLKFRGHQFDDEAKIRP